MSGFSAFMLGLLGFAGATMLGAPTPVVAGPGARPGIWMWLWPKNGWNALEPERIAQDLVDLGCVGVIPQAGMGTMGWCTPNRIDAFRRAGLEVCAGFGMDGSHTVSEYVQPFVAGLDVCGSIMGDWERLTLWENSQGHALAQAIVDGTLAARPNAAGRSVDAPWWAPVTTPNGNGSHPNAPTRIFGKLFSRRFVQAYGAGMDGASTSMLQWARQQYPGVGTPARSVGPSFQMYARSVNDQVQSLIAEPSVCAWDFVEMDASARRGLKAVKELRRRGYDGVGAVRAFQRDAGVTVDNIVGAHTLAALGVP